MDNTLSFKDHIQRMQHEFQPQPEGPQPQGLPPRMPHATHPGMQERVHGNTRILTFHDGSAVVGDSRSPRSMPIDIHNHDQNLALCLDDQTLTRIGWDLKSSIEDDVLSQQEYFDTIASVIDLLGIKPADESEKSDLPYNGAPTVKSMALFQTAMYMVASASASLYPSTGMVDTIIRGQSNDEIRDRAWRIKEFFNLFLTDMAPEFRKECRRTIFWTTLMGSIYKKVFIDPVLGRPTSLFIRPEDFIINRSHSTHLTAERKTHILRLSKNDMKIRQLKGIYRRNFTPMTTSDDRSDTNVIQEELDEISGIDSAHMPQEEFYRVFETYGNIYIKEDPLAPRFEFAVPYKISIDAESGRVLSIFRNWKQGDTSYKGKEYFVNYSCFPALDGEGYGLLHYASRLAEAATIMRKQIINAATYANFPAFLFAQGLRMENNNLQPGPGEGTPIMTGGIPLKDAIMPLPYKGVDASMFEILKGCEDDIKAPSHILNNVLSEMAPRAASSSILAVLDNTQRVPNMINQGFHESFKQELSLFRDRFYEWLPQGKPYPFLVRGGQAIIAKEDFAPGVIIEPASDPSMHNSAYRLLQAEVVLNQAKEAPQLHNMYAVYQDYYKKVGVPDDEVEKYLVNPQTPPPPIFTGDPVTENSYVMQGKPITVNRMQDHDAHIATHDMILNDQNSQPEQISSIQAHIQMHRAEKFVAEMQMKMGIQIPEDPSQVPPQIQNQIAQRAAQVAQQKIQQQQAQNPPPLDPTQVMLLDVKNKEKASRDKHEIERLRIAFDEHRLQSESRIEELKLQQKTQFDALKLQLENKKVETDRLSKQHAQLIKKIQVPPVSPTQQS